MKRLFKLINDEIIFGSVEVQEKGEIVITDPYTVKGGNMAPLMQIELNEYAKGVQIHPMNIIYNFPLEEFPNLNKMYIEQTTGIITDSKQLIV